ncbi:MAG TPA: DMT family transporter [Geminicoccaceae bacterium]|nr:DMT family transporter [Geminicoccaceae bacterium]
MGRPVTHWLLLFALVAMWGSAFMMTGIAVRALSPTVMVTVRLMGGAILLGSLVFLRRMRFPTYGRFWLFSLLLAITGNCVPFWLISFGQQRVDSGLAGILMGIMPLTTMLLAHFFVPGERLNAVTAAGFAMGFAGLVALLGPTALSELHGQGGLLLYEVAIVAGAVCYAIQAIVARHRPPADPQVAAAGVMLMGALIMSPIGLPRAPAELAAAPAAPLWALAALTLVATSIATVVFLKLVVAAGPSFTSFMNYLIPVWAVLMGMLFLGERPGSDALIALLLILGGIAVSELGRRRLVRPARQGA